MQGIILAAGMGKRLKELTEHNTKCMIEVNGTTLIERMLRQIDARNFSRIIIVVGYQKDALIDFIDTLNIRTPVTFIENPVYESTNNIYSLSLTKDLFREEDSILFESDSIFEDAILDELLNDETETLALAGKYESWMDGSRVELNSDHEITRYVPENEFKYTEDIYYYKTVNIYKFSRSFINEHYLPYLESYLKEEGNNHSYEQVLKVLTDSSDVRIKAKIVTDKKWYEINDIQDLELASIIFNENEDEKLSMIQSHFGGYWRFPDMLDYCFLVNPYFPPEKLHNELKANFNKIITQYPSGLRINSLLAAKSYQVNEANIVVGNGTSEYIKLYMEQVEGRTGFISPTFEEYPNRYDQEQSVVFVPDNRDYLYDENDIMNYFDDKDVQTIVIVNPDNPSGNYICKNGLLRLVEWAETKNIRIVIDESFVDFATEENATLITQEIMDLHPSLVILKSISKSYGIPGLRLGVLASGDRELIAFIKKKAAIWNINSLAEFYMQIEGKYKKDYAESLVSIKAERARFYEELCKLDHIHVIPSEANYFMIELLGTKGSRELTRDLLIRHDIFIKDLFKKTKGKQYIRIAVRSKTDNDRLLKALKEEL